jgi:small subunit ribosomal protein S13
VIARPSLSADVTPGLEAGARSGHDPGAGGARHEHDTSSQTGGPRVLHRKGHHMARLVGVDLPRDKRIEVALTYIYGIGRTRAQAVLATTGVDPNKRVHELGDEDLVKLRDEIESSFRIEGDLRREVQADIRRKIEIGSYQGRRHRMNLPVRGQRTKTNARTRKGPKRTVAGKKKSK